MRKAEVVAIRQLQTLTIHEDTDEEEQATGQSKRACMRDSCLFTN